MAHTKSGGSTSNGRDSKGRRLGIKRQNGQRVFPGEILIRQRGTKYMGGENVRKGRDDTLYAAREGVVAFSSKNKMRFDGSRRRVTVVEVRQS